MFSLHQCSLPVPLVLLSGTRQEPFGGMLRPDEIRGDLLVVERSERRQKTT